MGKFHKLLFSKKVFHFKSIDPDAVFRFVPGKGYFIKWRGREERPVSPKKSNLLVDSMLDFEELKKEDYMSW